MKHDSIRNNDENIILDDPCEYFTLVNYVEIGKIYCKLQRDHDSLF